MATKIARFILLFFMMLPSKGFTQKQPIALKAYLQNIEKEYAVHFSYLDATIENKTITPLYSKKKKNLTEIITYLELKTALKFEAITATNYSISKYFTRQLLSEVVITKYLTSGISKNYNGSITVQPQKLKLLPGMVEPDILQSLQTLPGILNTDERLNNISIRGGTHDQNLILWEGIKMYQSSNFFGLISAFNPYAITKVTVTKNGTPAKYSDGVSSTITMQMPKKVDSITGGLGFNFLNLNGFAAFPISKKMGLQIAARNGLTSFLDTPIYKNYSNYIFQDSDFSEGNTTETSFKSRNDTYNFYDLNVKLNTNLSKKDILEAAFIGMRNRLTYIKYAFLDETIESYNSKLEQRNIATGVTYKRIWNSNLSTTFKTYLTNYKLDADNVDLANNMELFQENKVQEFAFKMNTTVEKIFKHSTLDVGYQFLETSITNTENVKNPDFYSLKKEVLRNHAGYASLQYNTRKTKIETGIRWHYFTKLNDFLIEPRIRFSQQLANHFKVLLLGEFKSQSTLQIIDLQKDFLGIEKRRWVLANNENIPLLKSKQASLEVQFKKNNSLISGELYYKTVANINSRSQSFVNQFQFQEAIGSYYSYGFDFLIRQQFKNVNSWISYSFAKNKYLFSTYNEGEKFPTNTDVTHGFNFSNTLQLKAFHFGLGLQWHSGVPYTKPDASNTSSASAINYSTPNSARLKSYFRADFSSTYSFSIYKNTRAKAGISFWNIFDTKNTIQKYYRKNSDGEIQETDIKSIGFTPNISFLLQF